MSDELFERTIVIVGKTGNGKSATGNTLLGRTHFGTKRGASGFTKNIDIGLCKRTIDNCQLHLKVIDTPGLFDCGNLAQKALQILKVGKLKPHIFCLVLSDGRFTDEEKYTLDLLKIIFGADVLKHIIVVVTHGNTFQNEADFQEFLDNEQVNQLVESCGNRVLRFENMTKSFNFIEFRRIIKVLQSEFVNQHWKIHKSVIEKYLREKHGDKTVGCQLEDMNKELALRLPNWINDLILCVLLIAASALLTCFVHLTKPVLLRLVWSRKD